MNKKILLLLAVSTLSQASGYKAMGPRDQDVISLQTQRIMKAKQDLEQLYSDSSFTPGELALYGTAIIDAYVPKDQDWRSVLMERLELEIATRRAEQQLLDQYYNENDSSDE